ncbi:TonB-dependent receptor plug domain-containing protein [Lentisalinibacter sediminis]|uniref:TonB-dependent receptor plug domain-containing protein n=1 Tax=Lentisalinibacter sediminis TaxID=2992237 RepID=UPI00386F58E7
MKKTPLAAAISCILANGSLMTTPVLAQDDDEPVQAGGAVVEEIIVTGSRIRKDVFTSSAPMDVIDVSEASIQGVANVGELLQRNTVAAGSPQVTPATSAEFVQNGGIGVQTLSLRGLGANRTLVLLNGRRAGPSGTRGSVSAFDLNVLPLATIERVEILKDGASSIYGSDAVAGVVNIITRKDDGGVIDGFVSQPTENGGEETRLSASWGRVFDRGNFRITADYSKQSELQRGDRDYFECGNQFIFDPNTGERADVVDPRSGNLKCEDLTWGHIWIYDYAADTNIPAGPSGGSNLAQFDYDNDLGQYIPGYGTPDDPGDIVTPSGWFPVGYNRVSDGVTNSDHPFQDGESLVPENELITLYGEAEYQITDDVTAYTEVLFNRRTTKVNGYRQYWTYLYSGNFDFGSLGTSTPGGGSQLSADAGWFGEQWYSPTAITDHADDEIEIDYQRFVAGLRGALTDNWEWDLALQYSNNDGDYSYDFIYDDSISDQWFATGSCVGQTTSVRGAPCVDVPWFSEDVMRGVVSPEVREFLFGRETGNTEYIQWSFDGFMTGELLQLPAGALSAAFGFHYREDEIDDLPGENIRLDNAWGDTAAGNTVGDDSTQALFVEFDVPVVADLPAVRRLTLNASARYTDVDSYGDDTTWKLGVNWQIIDSVRLRANQGTSFRAPALFELYLADQVSFADARIDPCRDYADQLSLGNISQTVADNCAADPAGLPPDFPGTTISPQVTTGGGLGVLEAETSKSKTIGLIWQPEFADLSVSIDYFDITVNDQVDQLSASTIVGECYASNFGYAFGGNEPLCDLFDRTGAGDGIDNIQDSFLNIAEQTNRGIDYALRYNTEIDRVGTVSVELQATRQIEDTRALFAETKEDLNGLVGDPQWVGEYNVSLYRGAFSFYYGGNYIGTTDSTRDLGSDTVTYFGDSYRAVLSTDSVIYHNFSASYEWEEQGLTVLLGVANAFDEEPPQLTTQGTSGVIEMVGNSAFYSQYDWFGRRFFLNLKKTFD